MIFGKNLKNFKNIAKFCEIIFSKILSNFIKFLKIQLEKNVDFEKCCKMRINYLDTKISVDTDKNEPRKE